MSAASTELHPAEIGSAEQSNDAESAPRPLPVVLGIVGDSGSGKSTISDGVRTLIGPEHVTDLKLDDYHRFTRAERNERELTALNPAVHDLSLMQEHLQLLRSGRPIRNRSYDHSNGSFGAVRVVEPHEVVIARGLLGFPTDELRAAYDLAVFLYPEPELLFRWKLRRDVRSRGYKEAEVLKQIAQHLLDSKEFVLPQEQRADLVVHYDIPDPDAPDSAVRTWLTFRRNAAHVVQEARASLDRFGDSMQLETRGDRLILQIGPELSAAEVERWARERFPTTFAAERIGSYQDETGGMTCRVHLTFVEVLIARLAQKLRRTTKSASAVALG